MPSCQIFLIGYNGDMNNTRRGINAYKAALNRDEIKTVPAEESVGLIKVPKGENRYEKAAKLLVVLGKEEASKVLKHLPEEEVEKITLEVSRLKRIPAAEAEALLKEVGDKNPHPDLFKGGKDIARSILSSAFGEEKGEALFKKAVPETLTETFSFLEELDETQLVMLLKKESVHVLPIVLHNIDPQKASLVIKALTKEERTEVIRRIASLKRVDMSVIKIIENNLKDKIEKMGKVVPGEKIDGHSALAEILKHMDASREKAILAGLADEDPGLGEAVKEKLYTMDIIHNLRPADLQTLLRDFSDKEIVTLLKGESEHIQRTLKNSMSSRRLMLIEEDMVFPVKKSDADEMSRVFVKEIRAREERGELVIFHDDEEYIY